MFNKCIYIRIFIVWILFSIFFSICRAEFLNPNLTSPHSRHPNPEAVAQDVLRSINASVSRRQLLGAGAGDNCRTGNPIDDCWRCDPDGWANNRQRLADCAIGFGRGAGGGKGGAFYTVTDPSDGDTVDPSPGTLRYGAVRPEPLWITFAGDMTIELSEELIVASRKTIDGRGAAVHIVRGSVTLQYAENVIVHNVHIHDCVPTGGGGAAVRSNATHAGRRRRTDGDGVTVFGSREVWIDHCSLWRCADGLIDVVEGSTAVTISNCHFSRHDLVMLFGHDDSYTTDKGLQVTVAFNVFGEALVQRMPRCRLGYFHVVNNDYTGWEMYAIGGSANPTINSQGNRYRAPDNSNGKEVTKHLASAEDWKEWNWRSEGDALLNGAFFVQSGSALEERYSPASSINPICSDLIDQLTLNAGAMPLSENMLGKSLSGVPAACGTGFNPANGGNNPYNVDGNGGGNNYDYYGYHNGSRPLAGISPASYLLNALILMYYLLFHVIPFLMILTNNFFE